ncbi:endo alpha-1,4 polygalactosaminidase [Kurthia sibirica]|uniref:Glycoside-hydrolase family GH114 TIM-barrel domain-containing protein n=1 Tax=Kurthia sibirica TaxID=202750 RepID=A0A2U3ANC9_9BACL|nr:endo alpha-1,4 polygalactosaminidase [Kurthia sibirica]PWI26037.1 hypothetical protein DEX24_05775 [Kurthia sibirica]GEK34562.1 hypothetical protein KSI01_20950 [Kurthia sibirica]
MKKYTLLIALLLFSSPLSACAKEASPPKFNYYLDAGSPAIAKKMAALDIVIVEPIEMQKKYIRIAQKNNTQVFGYINSTEGDQWNQKLFQQFKKSDFYHDKNGKRLYFKQWDSYQMRMSSKHYRSLLMKEIEHLIVDRGLDGVFLDTVGNIEDYLPKKEQKKELQALQSFIKDIKTKYPQLTIAQNWGFTALEKYTQSYIDYFLWEDFSYKTVGNDAWAKNKMKLLNTLQRKNNLHVLTISFSDAAKSAKLAKENGFSNYYNKEGSYYNKW